jgi:hypothetical protein
MTLTQKFGRALATAQHGLDILTPGITDLRATHAIEGFWFLRSQDGLVLAAIDGVALDRATPTQLEVIRELIRPAIVAFFNTTIANMVANQPVSTAKALTSGPLKEV